VQVKENYLLWMEAGGLRSWQDFVEKPVGELISRDHKGRELRRISIEVDGSVRVFYLKRMGREPIAKLAHMLLFGRWPCSGPIRELRMLENLQQEGFATMRQAAYGEKRILGWPVGGFLMVEEVEGSEVGDLVKSGDSALLGKLYLDLGVYLGKLHIAGFFQVVRLKDLFCTAGLSKRENSFEFILIDRETSKPWKKRFSKKSCFDSLARTARRILRDGYRLGHGDLRNFFRGYLAACESTLGNMNMVDFRKEFFFTLRRELRKSRS
jgi:hypothetical protein